MQEYTDSEVLAFVDQQEQNFKNTAKRSDYEGAQAKRILKEMAGQSQEERLANGRLQLGKLKR